MGKSKKHKKDQTQNQKQSIAQRQKQDQKIITGRHILEQDIELEEPLEVEEDIFVSDHNDDELEPLEPLYGPFEQEDCFSPPLGLLINLEDLTVEAITVPIEYTTSLTKTRMEMLHKLAKILQNELRNLHKNGEDIKALFEKYQKFIKHPRDEIPEQHWEAIKNSTFITIYEGDKFIGRKPLFYFTRKPGSVPKMEKRKFIEEILSKYDYKKAKNPYSFAQEVWNNEKEAQELWKGKFDTFRKYLSRNFDFKEQKQ